MTRGGFATLGQTHKNEFMKIVVRKFASLQAADAADDEHYSQLNPEEKLQILLELIRPENPDDATIQRFARIYPLARSGER